MFIIQYPPPDIGNSFCLVVRIFGSEPKGPQFYPRTATVVTRKNTQQHLLSVPLLDGSTKNSIYFYIQQMAATQLTPISPKFKVYVHFIAQSLRKHINLRICTQHTYRFLDIQIISRKKGCSCSAPYCHHFIVMFIIQHPPPDIGN
ncbi:hypothetical protein AVEN_256486-1 [Araneus ventricosus]|uniref:Uncharacterized protein n=1 Tax=Araneus ventricosus TaxID=182803 RepID=A0A4Y2RP95_ARAVE|nr:hypothetical protein AVEN_256486-1 [Araneus ventricosus]